MSPDTSLPFVVNTSRDTFQTDVVDRSHETPVVLDFWAPWCGPCRMLGPVLEKLAADFQGRFVLVKANTDEVPEAAAQFNASSIPAVFAVWGGQIVDFFNGALPEPMVREWLDRVLRHCRIQAARKLESVSAEAAEAEYRELLAADPQNADVKIGLARSLVAQQRWPDAQAIVDELDSNGLLDAEGKKLRATLALRQTDKVDLGALRKAAESKPNDLAVQFELAEALAHTQQYEESLEILLSLVQRDKKGFGARARELMVQIFQALPDDSELTSSYRRKLSLALY